VIEAAREDGAAVPALAATETLGRIRDEVLEGIVPRERVVGIQTPQAFKLDILRSAFDVASETISTATDESSLVLAAGYPVRVVEGERWNIKVTVKEDLEIVESFITGKLLTLPGWNEEQ
jgi:2-C-methyl-D-erythritol 4-phosphate cytidylyltransferase